MMSSTTEGRDQIRILEAGNGPALPIVEGGGHATAVIWPGMGAQLRSIHMIRLEPGARTVQLRHPSEAVYSVTGGSGEALDAGARAGHPLRDGSMVHVDAGTAYAFRAGSEGMSLLGGPSPPDPALYRHLR
jgi:quercetin dioxygenase-like cupin family protein